MSSAGSYAYAHFSAPEEELDRLELQATAGIQIERQIWQKAGLRPGMRVLDLACGPGVIASELARFVGPEGSVLGVDISPLLLEDARKRREMTAMRNLGFAQADVYDLQFEAQFDFIYARFLFQHLKQRQRVAHCVAKALAPGGIACIMDVDDAWLMFHPPSRAFDRLVDSAAEGQRQSGGSRYVGRHLESYLRRAQLVACRTRVQVVTTHDLGMKPFLDITTRFKAEQAPDREQAQRWLQQIDQDATHEDAWGAVGVFVTTGEKPI